MIKQEKPVCNIQYRIKLSEPHIMKYYLSIAHCSKVNDPPPSCATTVPQEELSHHVPITVLELFPKLSSPQQGLIYLYIVWYCTW